MDKKNKTNKTTVIVLVVIALLLLLGSCILAYKKPGSGGIINKGTWKVTLLNNTYTELSGSVKADNVDINNTKMVYTIPVKNAGEFYEATIDVKNEGTIDAKMDAITMGGLSEQQKQAIQYTVTYGNNSFLSSANKLGYTLKAGETVQVRIFVLVNEAVGLENGLTLEFTLSYVKK